MDVRRDDKAAQAEPQEGPRDRPQISPLQPSPQLPHLGPRSSSAVQAQGSPSGCTMTVPHHPHLLMPLGVPGATAEPGVSAEHLHGGGGAGAEGTLSPPA